MLFPWRSDTAAALLIAAIALVARMPLVLTVPEYPLVADMQEYWDRAVYLLDHAAFSPSAWRMPGYPAALALTFKLASGPSLLTARLFNTAAGVATAVLTYLLARRTVSVRASFGAALLMALYPTFLLYVTLVVTEAVVTVPVLGALLAASYNSKRASAVAGLCAGMATLVRPAGIATLPVVLWSLTRTSDTRGSGRWILARPTIAAMMFLVAMVPWWIHNARAHSRFVPFDTTGGYNFLVGNASHATGLWQWDEVVGPMEADLQKKRVDWTTPAGADTTTAMAIADIQSNPLAAARRIPAKLAGLLAIEGREHAYLYSRGYFGARRSTVVWLWGICVMVAFPGLFAAALFALTLPRNINSPVYLSSAAYIGVTILMHLITFGDPRYHLPLVPVLAVLATGIENWGTGFSPRRLLVSALILLWLFGPWSRQLSTYWTMLTQLAVSGGWQHAVPFIDLR